MMMGLIFRCSALLLLMFCGAKAADPCTVTSSYIVPTDGSPFSVSSPGGEGCIKATIQSDTTKPTVFRIKDVVISQSGVIVTKGGGTENVDTIRTTGQEGSDVGEVGDVFDIYLQTTAPSAASSFVVSAIYLPASTPCGVYTATDMDQFLVSPNFPVQPTTQASDPCNMTVVAPAGREVEVYFQFVDIFEDSPGDCPGDFLNVTTDGSSPTDVCDDASKSKTYTGLTVELYYDNTNLPTFQRGQGFVAIYKLKAVVSNTTDTSSSSNITLPTAVGECIFDGTNNTLELKITLTKAEHDFQKLVLVGPRDAQDQYHELAGCNVTSQNITDTQWTIGTTVSVTEDANLTYADPANPDGNGCMLPIETDPKGVDPGVYSAMYVMLQQASLYGIMLPGDGVFKLLCNKEPRPSKVEAFIGAELPTQANTVKRPKSAILEMFDATTNLPASVLELGHKYYIVATFTDNSWTYDQGVHLRALNVYLSALSKLDLNRTLTYRMLIDSDGCANVPLTGIEDQTLLTVQEAFYEMEATMPTAGTPGINIKLRTGAFTHAPFMENPSVLYVFAEFAYCAAGATSACTIKDQCQRTGSRRKREAEGVEDEETESFPLRHVLVNKVPNLHFIQRGSYPVEWSESTPAPPPEDCLFSWIFVVVVIVMVLLLVLVVLVSFFLLFQVNKRKTKTDTPISKTC